MLKTKISANIATIEDRGDLLEKKEVCNNVCELRVSNF